MPARGDALALKRQLSPVLLALPGVSGVGVRNEQLCVYLVRDDPEVRRSVEQAVRLREPAASIVFEVSGRFVKQ